MAVFAAIVFLGVFIVVALVMNATTANASPKSQLSFQDVFPKPRAGGKDSRGQFIDFRRNMTLSAIPWINRLLLKVELAPRLRILLYQSGLKWTTGSLVLMSMTCFSVSAWLTNIRSGSGRLALLIGLILGCAPLAFVLLKRRSRFGKFEQELPEALDLMVSALRAGHSLNAAMDLVSRESQEPLRSEFRTCFDEQNYGLELRTAMDNMTVRVPLQDLRIATTAILIQKESGGNLAEVLNKTAEVIRERFRLKRQVKVHTAHGRLTGMVIAALPIALLVILYVVNPGMESILWKTELGVKLLYAAGGMMVVGGLIIRKIVNMDV
jgi:tight adherence protein B